MSAQVAQTLPAVAKAVSFQHYPQHVVVLETLCKQVCIVMMSAPVAQTLPAIAKAVSFQHYPQHVVVLETLCKQV